MATTKDKICFKLNKNKNIFKTENNNKNKINNKNNNS